MITILYLEHATTMLPYAALTFNAHSICNWTPASMPAQDQAARVCQQFQKPAVDHGCKQQGVHSNMNIQGDLGVNSRAWDKHV